MLVRGGLPRAYFMWDRANESSAVCLVPRGAEEGSTLEVDREDLQLVANKPVSFRLYSSLTRTDDQPGEVVRIRAATSLHLHAPLKAVIRFGKQGERLVPVKLGARLTEIGTLETWCESKISEHRWRLQFELRKARRRTRTRHAARGGGQRGAWSSRPCELVARGFLSGRRGPSRPGRTAGAPGTAAGAGPQLLAGEATRELADAFLADADGRKKSRGL